MDIGRRTFIRDVGNTGIIALLVAYGFLPERACAELWNKAAFDATSLEEALDNILDGTRVDSNGVEIIAPEIAENGNTVPISVSVESAMSGDDVAESVMILAEGNPRPEVAPLVRRAERDQGLRLTHGDICRNHAGSVRAAA